MTPKEREMLQRAAGIVDGVSSCVDKAIATALISALEILDTILEGGTEDVQE